MRLKAQSIDYIMWSGVAVTVYVIERTPELMRLHEDVIKAVEPFSVSGGTGTAFVGTDINTETIGWVENFIPKSSGPNYIPHVTLGIAKQDFANQLKTAPFAQFTFSPIGAAVYHLGNFGTAAKKLWNYERPRSPQWNDGPRQAARPLLRQARLSTEGILRVSTVKPTNLESLR